MTRPWYLVDDVEAIASPALLVYPDRVRENIARMIAVAGGTARLRPHVKTHKLPQIIRMKRAAGIRKFKVSTIAEAEMTATAGGEDILLAYQPVGPNVQRLVTLMRRFPETRFATLVDDAANLAAISRVAVAENVAITLYLDLNVGMNRTCLLYTSDAADAPADRACTADASSASAENVVRGKR